MSACLKHGWDGCLACGLASALAEGRTRRETIAAAQARVIEAAKEQARLGRLTPGMFAPTKERMAYGEACKATNAAVRALNDLEKGEDHE